MRIPFVTCVHNSYYRHSILMGVGDLVITGCRAEVELMVSRGIPLKKLRPVLNGTIGSARQSAASKDFESKFVINRPALLTASGLHPRKGVADLIVGFKKARFEIPDLNLYIFGKGPNEKEYQELSGPSDVSNIHFLGYAPILKPFFLRGDVFILASLADPAPLAMSEAREAGLAIIGTNVPGIPELLEFGEAGILISPGSPTEIAEKILYLFRDEDRLKVWKEKSQYRIDHLRVSRVAMETISVYKECVSRMKSV
jgi:glycosyltransferase involved in cell wall biosynthesis